MSDTTLSDVAAYEALHPHPAGIGPSDIGRCPREVAYRVRGVEPDQGPAEILTKTSWLGQAVHAHLATVNREIYPDALVEEPVPVAGMNRPGTLDLYLNGRVTDYKTKSARGMDAILSRGKAYEADVSQTEIYALGLIDRGLEVTECAVTYVDRSGGDVFTDSWTFDHPRALAALGRLHALQDAIDDGEELPRQGRGPGLGRPCDSCQWIVKCWDLEKVPQGYTAQSAFAAPAEVAEAASALAALRAEASMLKEAEAYYKAVLVGHGGARFTDAEGIERMVKWSTGSTTGGQLDSKAVRAILGDLSIDPPTLGTAPRLTTPAAT